MDFIACEPQFLDHLAPVWNATDPTVRGTFFVDGPLYERAGALGVEATVINAVAIRSASRSPDPRLGAGPSMVVASVGDTKVGRRMGYNRFAFIEHGAGQAYNGDRSGMSRHPSYAGGVDRDDTSLFLVPNEYSADLWRKAYPTFTTEVVGCPKLDTLPAREPGPGPVVAISFHWPAFVAPEAGTAFGYYLEHLHRLTEEFTVIGHSHPKGDWPERMKRYYDRFRIPFVPDFADVCRQADVYVCDNSSTIFEFASTGRPVVVLNAPTFRKNVHHGLRFWDAADVGVQVDRGEDLVWGVAEALKDSPERRTSREAALRIAYAYPHNAAERAADALARWGG